MKVGDWIKVPNAFELAGNGYKDNHPMRVDEVMDGSVRAWGCQWFPNEYQECPSPLFAKYEDEHIMDSEGYLVVTIGEKYKHKLDDILVELNKDFY